MSPFELCSCCSCQVFSYKFRLVLTLEMSEMSAVFCFHNQNNSTSSPGSIPWNMYRCTCIITLVSWCRLRRRRNEIIFFFSCLQLDALRSLKMNSTMNIVDNYRPVQNLGSRKVKSSLSSTQAPPTTTAVPVPT